LDGAGLAVGAVTITAGGTGALTVNTTATNTHSSLTISSVAAGKLVTVTGNGPANITTTTTGTHTIFGGAGADTMVGGSGIDEFTGGLGADFITLSGADYVHYTAGAADTGIVLGFNFSAVVPVTGTAINVTGLDVITGYTTSAQIDVGAIGLGAVTMIRNGGTFGTSTTGNQALVTGTYASGTFTIGTSGADSLYVWDSNGTTDAGGVLRGIVLVGYIDAAGNDTAATTGLIAVA
jgi:hypothetical protein